MTNLSSKRSTKLLDPVIQPTDLLSLDLQCTASLVLGSVPHALSQSKILETPRSPTNLGPRISLVINRCKS